MAKGGFFFCHRSGRSKESSCSDARTKTGFFVYFNRDSQKFWPKLDGFKRFLRFSVPGNDVSPIVMEPKWPSRDVVKTYFVDRGQSFAILDGDHHSENKDRSCFPDALFATQSMENSVLEREQPRRTRRGSLTSFRIARSAVPSKLTGTFDPDCSNRPTNDAWPMRPVATESAASSS